MGEHEQHPRGWLERHQVALYLVLAYVLSWSIWPLVLLNPTSSPLVPFGPGLAAVTVALAAGGGRGLLRLLRQLVRWRVAPRWYGAALGMPLAVTALALGAAVLAGAPAPGWVASDVLQVVGTLVMTVLVVGLFEELGWRGFLLPRLQHGRSALAASLVVGLVWLPWHLPELVSDRGERALVPFAITIMAQAVLLTWLYNSTRASLPVVILFHAAVNTFAKFFLADLRGGPSLVAWWTLAALLTLAALAVVRSAGSRTLVRQDGAPAHEPTRA